jgi:peptidyl-prolyl cis-trans isomerase D
MALKWLRDNLRHLKFILWGVVAVFVLLVFVDWGSGRGSGGGGGVVAVRVGDRTVSEAEFLEEMRLLNQRFSQIYGDRWNELRDQVDLAGQTASYLIDRELQISEAQRIGITVSSEELQEAILEYPAFRRDDGQFVGADTYKRILRATFRMSAEDFEQRLTEDLLVGKLNTLAERNVWISDSEVEREVRRQREVANFDVIQLRYEPFLSEVEISENDARAAFEASSETYRRDEERVIRYLLVETSRLRRLLAVDDADLREYYEQHVDEFLEDEQANARHILIRVNPDATEVQRGEAELRANGVATIARSGADFAALAQEHSEDPGSKDLGGDLGWFGRGRMVPEFDEAVFAAKPGDIVGPIRSQFGYHIIQVEGFRPEHQRPFEEVQEQVRFRVLEGRASVEAETRATMLASRLEAENPQTEEQWQTIADEDEAVVLNQSPAFGAGQPIPGASEGPDLANDAFSIEIGEIRGPIPVARGWIVWQLEDVREAGIPPFEDVRAAVEQELRRERAIDRASARGQLLAERWRAGEEGAALAAEFDSTVVKAADHRRGSPIGAIGVLATVDNAVFAAQEGEVVGPLRAGFGGVVIARVEALELMDPAELESQLDAVRARFMAERAGQLMRSILNERRRETVVTVDNELLQRFAPSRS